jgi:hypothetical protein
MFEKAREFRLRFRRLMSRWSAKLAFPANQRVTGAVVPVLAVAAFLGYAYGLQLMMRFWPLPGHGPWLYIVPSIQGLIIAVAVATPLALFLVRYLRPRAVMYGFICAIPVALALVPGMVNHASHAATRLTAAFHAFAFMAILVGSCAILRSNNRGSGPPDANGK